MPIRQYRPTSPGRRGMSVSTFEEITKTKPEKSLTVKLQKHAGRNNQGKITTRHRGGGAKRAYRIMDFKRNKLNVPAQVSSIEIDHEIRSIGKAGRSRHMGRRPTVRGSVMNPRDHPHGGGEGRAPIGGQPQTPWGKPALGYKTRNNKRTDQFIVRRRNAGRRKK